MKFHLEPNSAHSFLREEFSTLSFRSIRHLYFLPLVRIAHDVTPHFEEK